MQFQREISLITMKYLFAVLLFGILSGCGEESNVRTKTGSQIDEPDQILFKARIVITEDGSASAIIKANQVKIYEDSSYTSFEDSVNARFFKEDGNTGAIIEANFVKLYEENRYISFEDSVKIMLFDSNGKHSATLTSLTAEMWGLYESGDSLRAEGDVLIVSEEQNATLEAPAIRWIASEHKVYGEGLVIIRNEDGYEKGTGFQALDDLTEYEFTDSVSVEFHGKDIELFDR